MTKEDTRQVKSPHTEIGQGNTVGGRVLRAGKRELEIHLFSLFGIPQANRLKIYSEDLMQTHSDRILGEVFLSPHEACSVESVDHVLLVPSIPSDSYNLSSSFTEFTALGRGAPWGDL